MNFLKRLRVFTQILGNFLFPEAPRTLELESLSSSELLSLLSSNQLPKEEGFSHLFDYGHPLVKEIIWEVKYKGNRVLAQKLGVLLYDHIMAELHEQNIFEKHPSVLLVPVPTSEKRRFERGWNQAELLAEGIKACDNQNQFKYLKGGLRKVRHTESQTQTGSRKERLENLKDSMEVINPQAVEAKIVVLVDDVWTTGSTFREASRALKLARAKKIFCLGVAH